MAATEQDAQAGTIDFDEERRRDENSPPPNVVPALRALTESDNIAALLSEDLLGRIGAKVCEEYDIDITSRTDWTARNRRAQKLAMQVVEQKTYPWPKASNVKYPIITKAAMQYNARAYTALVKKDLVKCNVNGYDPDGMKAQRAERVGKTLSWQMLEQMEEWEEEMDQLLVILPIIGMHFKKTYFDPIFGRNVSEGCMAENVVFNYATKNFYKCPRVTHEIDYYPYEIKEKSAAGVFLSVDFGKAVAPPEGDGSSSPRTDSGADDPMAPHRFLEQHRLEDLDGDGLPEPYIVTVHRQTRKVVRIRARFTMDRVKFADDDDTRVERITPKGFFTKFGFLRNPDGSAHDIGFGTLIGPLNTAINRTLNMLMDAGHLANTQGGFTGSGLRMKGGALRLRPGEFKPLDVAGDDIRSNLVQIKFPEPSNVLFQLLGFLVDAANDIASIKDVLSGEQNQSNVPAATTLALIEQGLKVDTAINKRQHLSLKREFKLMYELNAEHLEPQMYITFLDDKTPTEVLLEDFNDTDLDVTPASDPKMLTDMQEIARAEALLPFAQDPDFDGMKIKLRYLEALGIPDVADLRRNPKEKAMASKQKLMAAMEETRNRRMEAQAKMITARARQLQAKTEGVLDLAKAEQENELIQDEISQYGQIIEQMSTYIQEMSNAEQQPAKPPAQQQPNGSGGVPSVAQPPLDGQVPGVPG